MFYSLFPTLFASSVLTIVSANPLPPPAGFSVTLNRSFHQRPPVNSSLPVCNVQPIEREFKGLQRKYRDVDKKFNNGINVGPINTSAIVEDEADVEAPFIPPVLVHTMPLADYVSGGLDMMYYGPLQIGTPPQQLTVDVDTGSADLWFPTADCADCENKQFEPAESSTCEESNETFSIYYVWTLSAPISTSRPFLQGSGAAYGQLMRDTVSVGGLEVRRQWFGGAWDLSGDFNDLPNDGLLGLAFSTVAQSGKPTFFENLIAKGLTPMFSMHLARHHDDSAVCFGCIDRLKTLDPIVWIPVLTKAYWSISMNAIIVNVNKARELQLATALRAIVDTGTTLIYLPEAVVSEFYAVIPGSTHVFQPEFEFYTFPCSTMLDIEFAFGQSRFTVNLADFNLGMTEPDSSDCVGGVLPLSAASGFPQDLAIMGDEFLKSWYSIFDYGSDGGNARVGFSPSINNAR
ncbi:Acid protease [Mycena sanguinolenta]|uniref:Acid protease n=1 Tax=Mycena sanguinolenta TaxID=230812 RepID=A0A8H7DKW2_9AGAR|nr:Acid protease [Mycena sanguinolenta]